MKSFIPEKLYKVLKWVAVVGLYALSDFVSNVFPLWNIPYSEPISKTLIHVGVLLGALLAVDSIQYAINDKKGE